MKLIVIFFITIFVLGPIYAKADSLSRVTVGAKTGVNLESFGGSDADMPTLRATTKFGFSFGGAASIRLHEYVAIQSEILYTTKGSAYEFNGENTLWLNLKYIEFPLLMHGRIPLGEKITSYIGNKFTPYVLVGPELSWLLGAEVDRKDSAPRDVKDDVNSIDLGICLAGGGAIALPKNSSITLEFRYDLGLLKVANGEESSDFQNQVLSLMVGYQLPLNALSGSSRTTTLP